MIRVFSLWGVVSHLHNVIPGDAEREGPFSVSFLINFLTNSELITQPKQVEGFLLG